MAEPDPQDSLDAATQATRSLQGLSTELTARVPQLLEAMRSIGTGLELHSTLDRICATAAELAHARYAAIGVVDESGDGLSDFITHGVSEEVARAIGRRPDGHRGLLGALIHDPNPYGWRIWPRIRAPPGSRPATRRCGPSSGCRSGSRGRSSATSI